jgi:hypothetical protein
MAFKRAYYAVYDIGGDLGFIGRSQKEIAEHLDVNEVTVWKTMLDGRRMVANHIVIKHELEKSVKKQIDVDKIAPKFKHEDGRYKRKYLAYDKQGHLPAFV